MLDIDKPTDVEEEKPKKPKFTGRLTLIIEEGKPIEVVSEPSGKMSVPNAIQYIDAAKLLLQRKLYDVML